MKKVCVLYYSKYGSTKSYAEMIGKAIEGELIEFNNNDIEVLMKYDVIVIGSGIYANNLRISKYVKKNWDILKEKNIIVFGVGASPVDDETTSKLKDLNFKKIDKDKIKFFLLRGAFDYGKLNFEDKIMMSMFKAKLKSLKEIDEAGKAILKCCESPENWVDELSISGIIEEIRNM